MTRALDTAGTAEALDRYRERAGQTLAGGVVALVGGVVVGFLPGPAWTGDVVAWAVCLGVVFACVGAGALVTARRMRAVLTAGEWSAHAAVPVAIPIPVPVPVPAAVTPVGTASSPAYERLAALAGRQSAPGSRRPEADVRSAPWWRVRGLRRISGLSEVLVTAGSCACAGGLLLLPLEGFERAYLFGLGAVSLLLLVFRTFRFLTGGAGAARLLVRAATAPVPVVRRYALLHDPRDDVPVLVLFPAHGGPDDLPEAVLPLVPPGPQKKPRLGLPPSSTGTVDLRGWLDRTDDGQPVVVPWIDDRPLWPAGPYRETGAAEVTSLLDRLAPPPAPAPRTLP
ncbi:hypothetical protein [Streptomyces sp. NPDC088915]|uniref:hypothetical protein n=1 Tax=Streptomyces sp. NPDC088915 TaxID=3365912 RepID=UPI0038083D9D